MDADSFVTDVEEAKATELDRLGSQPSLVALTDADLDAESVLRAAARSERAARETFAGWAETEADADASEAFAELARREGDHYERVVAELGEEVEGFDSDGFDSEAPDPMHEYLRGLDSTVERAAALVGRSLASERTQLQVINFFVNEADERRADLFRELRAETKDGISTGSELLETQCGGDGSENDDWERAQEVAEETVRVAYDDYAETLEGMGLDPRPIC